MMIEYCCYQVTIVQVENEWDDLSLYDPYSKENISARFDRERCRILDNNNYEFPITGKANEYALDHLSDVPLYMDRMPAFEKKGSLSSLLNYLEPLGSTLKNGDMIVVNKTEYFKSQKGIHKND